MSSINDKLKIFFAAAAPILIILGCWQPLKASSDIWAHAAVGRWIAEHHAIPHNALFLWSYQGQWTPHSWLAELGTFQILYAFGEMHGIVLIVLLSSITILTAFALPMWPVIKTGKMPILVAIMFIAALTASEPRFTPRPELFTTLFTVLLCTVLMRSHSKNERPNAMKLWWIPLLFALWVNLHGAVIFGLTCLWISAIATLLQDKKGWGTIAIAALSTFALLVNPEGIGYFKAFAPLVNHSFTYIDEWLPFWQAPQAAIQIPISEFILLVGAVTTWFLSSEKRWQELGWIALSTAAFISARRNMDLMALICLIVFCKNYKSAHQSEYVERLVNQINLPRMRTILSTATSLYFAYLLIVCFMLETKNPFIRCTTDSLPTQQADTIELWRIPGDKILNLYNSAAYLEWRLGEKSPLFIDSLNAYPNSVYDNWVQIWNATPSGLDMFNRSKVSCVAGGPIYAGQPLPLLYSYLSSNKAWELIYSGDDGPVFIRKGPIQHVADAR